MLCYKEAKGSAKFEFHRVMTSISSWERFKRFYKRNDIIVWSFGLVVFGHLFWWEIQHNPAFVPKHERKHQLGPVKIPYLDEYFANKKAPIENNNNNKSD